MSWIEAGTTSLRMSAVMQTIEKIMWSAGIALLLFYGAARADSELGRVADMQSFNRSEWSQSRLQAYEESLARPVGPVLAVVRVPSIDLAVPLYGDTSTLHLNRGVGLIEHMATPEEGGNLGIAGHRDGFFRVLARVRAGDDIEVRTQGWRYNYRVAFIAIARASDARLLAPTAEPVVTLVTCYPFYFVGHAPQRFVVRGVLVGKDQVYPLRYK
jgi:sortase A